MSTVKVQGNAGGTGSITLASPNTNNIQTQTLPDVTGTSLVIDGSGNVNNTSGVVNLGSGHIYKDASGNVGIGTNSPGVKLDVAPANLGNTAGNTTWAYRAGMNDGNIDVLDIFWSRTSSASGWSNADLIIRRNVDATASQGAIAFGGENSVKLYTNGSERARIDSSGNLLVGTTSLLNTQSSHTFVNTNATYPSVYIVNNTNDNKAALRVQRYQSDGDAVTFFYGTTQKGYITVASTGTTYNTLSDYRLKENVKPMVGALEKVAALKPVTYDWKDIDKSGQGFIAHELKAIVPECVTGEKDELDDEGNPKYQGIDTSFLVATLTAAIQEQQQIIADLKTRIETLEAK